jgi:GGDEF domain-containing protein
MTTPREAYNRIGELLLNGSISPEDAELFKGVIRDAVRNAYQDPVTQLGNRRKFDEDLSRRVQNAIHTEEDFCVVYADLDHFKPVNDTLGHEMGDKVLRAIGYLSCVANRMYIAANRESIDQAVLTVGRRNNDPVYRVGGDEWGYLVAKADLRAGMIAAERYRTTIEGNPMVHGVQMTLGVVSFRDLLKEMGREQDSQTPLLCDAGFFARLLRERADAALYAAKEAGRNRTYGYAGRQATYLTMDRVLQKP